MKIFNRKTNDTTKGYQAHDPRLTRSIVDPLSQLYCQPVGEKLKTRFPAKKMTFFKKFRTAISQSNFKMMKNQRLFQNPCFKV